MPIDYVLAKRLHTKHKAALTRAKKSGDPEKVRVACNAFFADFTDNDLPLPDNWHLWNNAQQDAEYAQRRVDAGILDLPVRFM